VHYRETIVWRKAIDMVRELYRLAPSLPKEEVYGVRSQITRAAVSVAANVAEGWTREPSKDKRHFLAIAHGSLAEVERLLTICEQLNWMRGVDTAELCSWLDEVSHMLTTMRHNRHQS
jgi:four helix bundle protein